MSNNTNFFLRMNHTFLAMWVHTETYRFHPSIMVDLQLITKSYWSFLWCIKRFTKTLLHINFKTCFLKSFFKQVLNIYCQLYWVLFYLILPLLKLPTLCCNCSEHYNTFQILAFYLFFHVKPLYALNLKQVEKRL